MGENYEILRQGTWLYDGEIACEVRIVKTATMLSETNAGGLEELPAELYCFQFAPPLKPGVYGLGPCFLTLAEALARADTLTNGTVAWA